VFNYDSGVIRLITILGTDVFFDPIDRGRRERFEKENTAVVFYEEIRRNS